MTRAWANKASSLGPSYKLLVLRTYGASKASRFCLLDSGTEAQQGCEEESQVTQHISLKKIFCYEIASIGTVPGHSWNLLINIHEKKE